MKDSLNSSALAQFALLIRLLDAFTRQMRLIRVRGTEREREGTRSQSWCLNEYVWADVRTRG